MIHSTSGPDDVDHNDPGPASASSEQTPRWVKVSAAAALALILVVAVVAIVGGGEHGPGRHFGGDETPAAAPGSGGAEGHTPPPGVDHGTQQP